MANCKAGDPQLKNCAQHTNRSTIPSTTASACRTVIFFRKRKFRLERFHWTDPIALPNSVILI
jgi:hypothetical protein